MIIFTSICANYTHKARLLAESVKRHIPDATFIVCLTEQYIPEKVKCEYFDEIILSKDVWKDEFNRFIFKHSIVEASTSVKGRFLQYLLEKYKQEDKIIYLDPDCYVYSDFMELRELLDERPIVVCPHLLQPGNIDMELSSTSHGIYNLGFLAVRRCDETKKFVDWWTDRLGLFCYDDIPRGIFTDQKWIDLAPCFFDVEIFKHRGYDFSIWSLLDCGMTEENGEYFIKGNPLRFIHFSGQGAMAEKCIRNWLPEGAHPFKDLYKEYSALHEKSDSDNVSKEKWTYNYYTDGTVIDNACRIAYRENIYKLNIENPFELNNALITEEIALCDVPAKERKKKPGLSEQIMQDFCGLWNRNKKIIFYGAGKYGAEFYTFCKNKDLSVECFIVGDDSGQTEFCGLPVVSAFCNNYNKAEVIVVLTLREALHEEVIYKLTDAGYKDIYPAAGENQYGMLHRLIKNNL